jgi:IS5 family transposase
VEAFRFVDGYDEGRRSQLADPEYGRQLLASLRQARKMLHVSIDRTNRFEPKAHVAMDQGSSLIRRAILTPAKIYESSVADELIQGDERAVYDERAYEHKERRRRLKAQGIKDRIMNRGHSNQPALPFCQQRRNKLIIPIRAAVEHLFGVMKRSYGQRPVRYFSLARLSASGRHRPCGAECCLDPNHPHLLQVPRHRLGKDQSERARFRPAWPCHGCILRRTGGRGDRFGSMSRLRRENSMNTG